MGHRRVHSEIFLRSPDEISFGGSMAGGDDEVDDLLATYMDMEKIEYFDEDQNQPMNQRHNQKLRNCFSVDDFSTNDENDNNNVDNNTKVKKNSCEAKKAMPPDKLAELWIVDPKRAKRILANRQSAARSKERKARYMQELEKKVKSLQTEATALSVQLSLFKRDTTGLTSENIELRRQLESMEQQAQLRDALNDALKQELDRLKVATGETSSPSSDTFAIPMQNVPLPSQPQQPQQQQQQQQQQSQCAFESKLRMNQIYPPETGLFLPLDQSSSKPSNNKIPQFCTTEANGMNYHAPQTIDSHSPQLGNVAVPPPYAIESNSQSPEQEVYRPTPSQPHHHHMLAQMKKQDHICKMQGRDINNGFDSYHLVKVEAPSTITNGSMGRF